MKYLAALHVVAVDDAVLLQNRKFHQICTIWSQNIPHFLTKGKQLPTLNVSDHKQRSYLSLKMPNHALFSPLLHNVSFHKQTVRALLLRMSISACVFLTGKQVTRPWYSDSQ